MLYDPIETKFSRVLAKNEMDTIRAVLNHTWSLNEEQRQLCDHYFIKKSTTGKLVDLINSDHDYIDTLEVSKLKFRVRYINGSTDYIQNTLDKSSSCLISFRGSKRYKTYAALVLINPTYIDLVQDKIPTLET